MLTMRARAAADTDVEGEEGRWRAVLERDASRDGRFVFAVRSTGIYCRPSCPARRPRRSQVAFYDAPAAAEQAGFRACKRCRPREGTADPRAALVARACRLLEAEREEPWRLPALARAAGASPRRLVRAFRHVLGVTPRQYAEARRLAAFKGRLKKGGTVTDALYEAGFGSSSRLYEDVQGRLGMTPATYGRGGRGMVLRYTTAATPLGRLLVAATERGVAAVSLGDSDASLEDALFREYPAAEVGRDEGRLREWVAAVLAELSGAGARRDLPLDVQATAFEHRVWRELRSIPRGQTRSYSEVARRLGRPGAARAVARACARNRVALVIPCHRVVEAGGGLGGYRWGTDRKRALLEAEKAAAPPPEGRDG